MKAYEELTDIEKQRLQKFADELFAEIETDEFLRELGYDPDELGKRMAKVAKDAMREYQDRVEIAMVDENEENRHIRDQCKVVYGITCNAINVLESIAGRPPEAQADEEKPSGDLEILRMRVTDLEWAAKRILSLAVEIQQQI